LFGAILDDVVIIKPTMKNVDAIYERMKKKQIFEKLKTILNVTPVITPFKVAEEEK
jgi:hypothetical protein